jgi:hypothetical protein
VSVRRYLFTLALLASLAFLCVTSVAMISAIVVASETRLFYSFPWLDFLTLVVLSAVAAVPPTQWIQKRLRKRRALNRIRAGKCNVCGYDVRASSSRCPECGTPIPVTNARAVFPSLSGASAPDQERTLDYGTSGPSKTRWIWLQAVTLTLGILTFVATLLYTGDLALRWCMLNLWK